MLFLYANSSSPFLMKNGHTFFSSAYYKWGAFLSIERGELHEKNRFKCKREMG
ncbi:hypothetical protein FH5_00079 [Priestia endophytica]|nr:hypothetical protein FH5_00079 [Priestia endophytica]